MRESPGKVEILRLRVYSSRTVTKENRVPLSLSTYFPSLHSGTRNVRRLDRPNPEPNQYSRDVSLKVEGLSK